eukprot:1697863-Prymnesium_polylepis.1
MAGCADGEGGGSAVAARKEVVGSRCQPCSVAGSGAVHLLLERLHLVNRLHHHLRREIGAELPDGQHVVVRGVHRVQQQQRRREAGQSDRHRHDACGTRGEVWAASRRPEHRRGGESRGGEARAEEGRGEQRRGGESIRTGGGRWRVLAVCVEHGRGEACESMRRKAACVYTRGGRSRVLLCGWTRWACPHR